MDKLNKCWTDVQCSFKRHERRIAVAKCNYTCKGLKKLLFENNTAKNYTNPISKVKIILKYEIRRGLWGEMKDRKVENL